MIFDADRDYQSNPDLQCADMTGNAMHLCTKSENHPGRHVQHDALTGRDIFAWRTGAESAFEIHEGALAAA